MSLDMFPDAAIDELVKRVYIVARFYREAEIYAKENNIPNWKFVHGSQNLLGLRQVEIILLPLWNERKDYDHLLYVLDYLSHIFGVSVKEVKSG